VPKPLKKNLKFRLDVIRHGSSSPRAASELWMMCARDPLFWANTFMWAFDPRDLSKPLEPFITYDYQDRGLLKILGAIGLLDNQPSHDLLIRKSRDMGASWECLWALQWAWQFRRNLSFMLVSRTEEMVDDRSDPDTLMWKLDFMYKNQPGWLVPDRRRVRLNIVNLELGGTITGAATTANVGRGGRRTAIFLDEFAAIGKMGFAMLGATEQNTNCRLFNSTPEGVGTAFNRIDLKGKTETEEWHWPLHPLKNRGLYGSIDGVLHIMDREYEFPPDYEFVLDNQLRSPFYDNACDRSGSRKEIAQQLDINAHASGDPFFDLDHLERIETEVVKPPRLKGELKFEVTPDEDGIDRIVVHGFTEDPDGRLEVWAPLDGKGNPRLERNYGAGCDVSAGSDASNSVCAVGDMLTGEKVAELTVVLVNPDLFAQYAIAIAQWFNGAKLIWEVNGPGVQFTKEVMRLGYTKVYRKTDETRYRRKVTDSPGWSSNRDAKLAVFGALRTAYNRSDFFERSYWAVREAMEYEYMENGGVGTTAMIEADPSSARANHGDRVMATALLWHVMAKAVTEEKAKPPVHIVPINSIAGRRKRRKDAVKTTESGWL